MLDDKLKSIQAQLRKGIAPPKETVRSLLIWFGAQRRGWYIVHRIRRTLKKYGIRTDPDFEYAYIDGYISFRPAAAEGDDASPTSSPDDPSYRIARLASANIVPTSVKPDASLQQAVTIMMKNGFSQLPVMTTNRDVKGSISWKSIGSRLALGKKCEYVRECMEQPCILTADESMFSAIARIAEHEYVLVRGADRSITGIITAADFNDQFRKLAEPFLLVGEIENGIRRMIYGKFSESEIKAACGPLDEDRVVEGIDDMTFGEYIRLLENDKRWKKLGLKIDRAEFVASLDRIRKIRNDVMHFDPDGLEEDDVQALREFAEFMKNLREAGVV